MLAFTLSTHLIEDRNNDGTPDLWRELYASGALRKLKIDSSMKSGRPDRVFEYDESGRLSKRSRLGDQGRILEQTQFGAEMLIESDPDNDGKFRRRETVVNVPGKNLRIHLVQHGELKWTWEETLDQRLTPDYGNKVAPTNDFTECLASGGHFSVSGVSDILAQIGASVEVSEGCVRSGFTKVRIIRTIATGIQCLIEKGGAGRGKAEEVLANVFATGKPRLAFQCGPTHNSVSQSGCKTTVDSFGGYSSTYGMPGHPRIWLNTGDKYKGTTEAAFNEVIFHETLHLGGHDGSCGHLHVYDNAMATESVEPCAQCCLGANVKLKKEYCKLCNGDFADDSFTHTSRYAALQAKAGSTWLALREAKKALMLNPDDMRANKLFATMAETHLGISGDDTILYLAAIRKLGRAPGTRDCKKSGMTSADFLCPRVYGEVQKAGPSGLSKSGTSEYYSVVTSAGMAKAMISECGPLLIPSKAGSSTEEKHAVHCYVESKKYLDELDRALASLESSKADGPRAESYIKAMRMKREQLGIWMDCKVEGLDLAKCESKGLVLKVQTPEESGCPRRVSLE